MKISFTLDPFKATRKIADNFVANFPLDWRGKKVKSTIKTKKKNKNSLKKEVEYKIHYRFVAKFMHVFCIVAFHIFTRFGRDDFGIFFL